MDASTLLSSTLSPNQAEREGATAALKQWELSQLSTYLVALSGVLLDESIQPHLRNAAGLAIKNTLSAREQSTQQEYSQRWNALDQSTKDQLKQSWLSALQANDRNARHVAAQVVAALACIELPQSNWNELLPALLVRVNSADNPGLRQASLETIGFVCESIKSDVLESQSNEILTCVVQGARKEEQSVDVQKAAIRALYNSLEFVKDNFAREGERNYIMQVVCEATQSPSADVQVGAFECLVKIMHLYYDHMKLYMERALFGLTVLGMKHEDEQVALQAVEFWSTVCDEEIELALEADEAEEFNTEQDQIRTSAHFARVALPEILPVLVTLLTKQDDDPTEDEWNVSMAAGTCLALLAQCVGDAIVAPIIPFVESNIKNPDWRYREAAVMAFGSILDGPEDKILSPLVQQALPTLIEMINDPSPHVQDTTAWTLGRITDVLVKTIQLDQHLANLITAILTGLTKTQRIVSNSCWSLMNLAEQLSEPESDSGPLSSYYEAIVHSLTSLANQQETDPAARTSAYEALSTLVTHATADCMPIVSALVISLLDRSEQLVQLSTQLVGADDRRNYSQLQVSICGLLTSIVRRLGQQIQPLSDRIMGLLLQLIQSASKQDPILDDAFLCIGAMTQAIEQDFVAYLPAFLPFLGKALESYEEYQLCSIAVGLIGDICRALGERSLEYCQGFMQILLASLQSSVLHRSVKPPILACFGDVALAVGPAFEPFLETTVGVLQQAGAMRADPTNYELVDYIITLREAILDAYTGIVGAFKSSQKPEVLLPYVNPIFTFLHLCLTDQDRTEYILRSSIGLIGDLAETFPAGQLKEALNSSWISDILKQGRTKQSGGLETRKVAKWAKEVSDRTVKGRTTCRVADMRDEFPVYRWFAGLLSSVRHSLFLPSSDSSFFSAYSSVFSVQRIVSSTVDHQRCFQALRDSAFSRFRYRPLSDSLLSFAITNLEARPGRDRGQRE